MELKIYKIRIGNKEKENESKDKIEEVKAPVSVDLLLNLLDNLFFQGKENLLAWGVGLYFEKITINGVVDFTMTWIVDTLFYSAGNVLVGETLEIIQEHKVIVGVFFDYEVVVASDFIIPEEVI